MAYKSPSKSQKLHFHLFWDAIKRMEDVSVFFIFIFIQINISCKYKSHMQLWTIL
jgi:hypothetical protein